MKFRPSLHSECPYSDVHFWQRICAELREQSGVRMNLTTPNCQGKGHMENRKVKFPMGRDLQRVKAG